MKNKWLHLRLDEDEYKLLTDNFSKTTEKKLSRYARKVFLSEPVTVVHRNGSLDELIAVLVKVQNDLNGVTNNYNQMVHKLHMSDNERELKAWISLYEKEKEILFKNIAEVKELIAEGAKLWLQ
ncbi:plasmid mobilization protein [Pedobacter insulae]|nr:plasmid mobilization relaxosome protein MobC [Pedobacter insulae]